MFLPIGVALSSRCRHIQAIFRVLNLKGKVTRASSVDRRPLILSIDDQPPKVRDLMEHLKPEGFDLLFPSANRLELLEQIARADYLLVERARLTDELLAAAHKVRLIQKCGRGVEDIDVAAVSRLGIPLCCTPGANSIGTAELTVALMLAVYRRLCTLHAALRGGRWLKFDARLSTYELRDKAVGIVGAGSVGQEVARILTRGFRSRVSYYSRRPLPPDVENDLSLVYRPLDRLLHESDIVSLHIPLTPETRHIINARRLAQMRPTAVLINTSRGAIVDEKALIEVLRDGTIAGAGLDVFEREPPDPSNPLLHLENVVLTPHCGGGTMESMRRVFARAFDNISRVERGEPLPQEDIIKLS